MAPLLPSIAQAQSEDDSAEVFAPDSVWFTQVLSKFIAGSSYDQLTPDVVMAAKRGMIDTIGVIYAANGEDVTRIVKQYVRTTTASGGASVLGGGYKATANLAAFANGAMAHALDYDLVIHVGQNWLGHPSVVIFPAVLAVAEEQNLSGKDLILAYCLGLEAYVKIGMLCGPQAYSKGWHNTSYIGTMAAAGAVAKLLGLDEVQTERCFGIAGSLAGGMRQNFGTMTKPLHAGIAARGGIEAATLAKAGLTGSQHIFEAPLGFHNLFSGGQGPITDRIPYGTDTITIEQFSSLLGAPWNIANPGLAYKICPSCRDSNYGMEAGLIFRQTRKFDVQQIAEVTCNVPRPMGAVLFYHDPKVGLEGKFSLEYVLARTLLDGVPKISDFTDERVNEPRVKALTHKMKWVPFDPPAGQHGVPEFVFKSADGQEFRTRPVHLTGEAENPVSNEFLVAKYDDCASAVLAPEARNRVRDLVFDLENVPSVRALTGPMLG
jgi:2-methylcitrate dehydratase PrpD